MAITAAKEVVFPNHQALPRWYATGFALVVLTVALRLLLHLLTANRYGIFRDELYYYACSRHLAWGYVDMPPLVPAVTWLFTKFLGSSLFVLRLIPALSESVGSVDRLSYVSVRRKTLCGGVVGFGDCGLGGLRYQRPFA